MHALVACSPPSVRAYASPWYKLHVRRRCALGHIQVCIVSAVLLTCGRCNLYTPKRPFLPTHVWRAYPNRLQCGSSCVCVCVCVYVFCLCMYVRVCLHRVTDSGVYPYQPGQPLPITVTIAPNQAPIKDVSVVYRVNHGQEQTVAAALAPNANTTSKGTFTRTHTRMHTHTRAGTARGTHAC